MPQRKSAKKTHSSAQKATFSKKLEPLEKKHLTIFIILTAVIGLLFFLRSYFVAVSVNGQPISRLAITSQLEKQGGKQVLDSLVAKTLILQEAKKRGITVADKEANDEIKSIELRITAQGQNLNQLLAFQGMSREDLKEQVIIQKIVEKMFRDEIKVSDKEIDQYVEANKSTLSQSTDSAQIRATAQTQLQQQNLNQKVQSLIAELKKKARIHYFVNYP